MKKISLTAARRAKLPAMVFSGSAALPGGMQAFGPHSRLVTSTDFPGVLFKRVESLDELIATSSGIMYTVSSSETKYMLQGTAFQDAIDRGFPLSNDPPAFLSLTGDDLTKLNLMASSHTAPFVSRESSLVAYARPTSDLDQSAQSIRRVFAVIAIADWGFGTAYSGAGEDGYSLSSLVDFGSVADVLLKAKVAIFGDIPTDAMRFVDLALKEFATVGPDRAARVGVNAVTNWFSAFPDTQGDSFKNQIRFGAAKVHASGYRFFYPTVNNPFAWTVSALSSFGETGLKNHFASVACGHTLAKHGVDYVSPVPVPQVGSDISLVLKDCTDNLVAAGIPLFGANVAALGPYRVGGEGPYLDGPGIADAVPAPTMVLDAIKGPQGVPGFVELMEATKWVCARAESLAKAS